MGGATKLKVQRFSENSRLNFKSVAVFGKEACLCQICSGSLYNGGINHNPQTLTLNPTPKPKPLLRSLCNGCTGAVVCSMLHGCSVVLHVKIALDTPSVTSHCCILVELQNRNPLEHSPYNLLLCMTTTIECACVHAMILTSISRYAKRSTW